jgi:Domain of unknown function (DUF6379)
MLDRYMICTDGFTNIIKDGRIVGFRIGARLPYYRGLGLSMVEDIAITVDGEPVPRDAIVFSVRDKSWTLAELEAESEERWEMGEIATLKVYLPGGLAPGKHTIELAECLRISYLPFKPVTRDTKELMLSE